MAKKFAAAVRKKFAVKKIVLFGSRARGDNFLESDFDFLVVSDDFKGTLFPQRMAEMLKYWNEKTDAETFCYTVEEFERKKKDGIVRKAIEEGKIL
ncbi:MAG: nucleotidyltransferase domain-containing protein [Candidatus Diapherotrites archaeon]|nr:nucleotidyltransferase domain-containing protein [Candidatus Diapherotrites archaeon]